MLRSWILCAATIAAPVFAMFAAGTPAPVRAQTAPMTVAVDAGDAPRGILHVRETIPVSAGPLTLIYPKWIPGEHAPNGPIENVASLVVAAHGSVLRWERDPVDMYAFHLDVPGGVSSLDVSFDFLGASEGQYSSARLESPNLFVLTWNKVILTPYVDDYRTLQIAPSVRLPGADWQFGTALELQSQSGATVSFKPVSEEMLVDSPLDAGLNVKKFPLGSLSGAPVELDVFADTPAELGASDATIAKFRNLVAEMHALYRARHFNHYTFLLTVSDVLPGEGVEHHQSSDNGTGGDFLTDAASLVRDGDLLPHEFNHSWDGKFRRPAGLATPNLSTPMHDEMLWVYEGMTQFYGDLQAERSGIWTKARWLDNLAQVYARLDTTTGRRTRSLSDTAVSAPYLYNAPHAWQSARRGVDFYDEGELLWLEADVAIAIQSQGHRSIDDMARAFFGRTDTGPEVITYTRDDIIAALGAVQSRDWRTFLTQRVDVPTTHPPDPFTAAGWRLVYTDKPGSAADDKTVEARYSIGITAHSDGNIIDVIDGSPAARAGIGPSAKIVAINGRALTGKPQEQLDAALRDAQQSGSVRLLVVAGDVYREVAVAYRDGPRFPHLERIAGRPDLLSAIAASRRSH